MGLRSFLGNQVDRLGTSLNLPELGISEGLAGRNTVNTNAGAMQFPQGQNVVDNQVVTPITNYGDQNLYPPTPTQDQTQPTGGGTPATPFQQYFGGQLYSSPEEYTAAVTSAITKSFNEANAQIEKSFQLGILDINQKEDMIKNNRKKALSAINSTFSSLSPEATQSEQFKAESSANKEQDTNKANLDLYKNSFTLEKQNTLTNNASTMNANKDNILNNALQQDPGGNYANTVNYQAPTLTDNVSGVYQNASGLSAGGSGAPAIQNAVGSAPVTEDVRQWLYQNFVPNK